MSTALASTSGNGTLGTITDDAMWRLIADGDLSKLNDKQKAMYYVHLCESLGLNPAAQPFRYIVLNSKLTLYAQKGATDQLRKHHAVSFERVDKEQVGDIYEVTVYATDRDGRKDVDTGAVNVKGLTGEALANAHMKAITKAKRRVTLSICGLGFLDESEVDSVPGARRVSGPMADAEMDQAEATQPRSVPTAAERQPPRHTTRATFAQDRDKLAAAPPEHAEIIDAETGEIVPTPGQPTRNGNGNGNGATVDRTRLISKVWASAHQITAKNRELADQLVHAGTRSRYEKAGLRDLTVEELEDFAQYLTGPPEAIIAELMKSADVPELVS